MHSVTVDCNIFVNKENIAVAVFLILQAFVAPKTIAQSTK